MIAASVAGNKSLHRDALPAPCPGQRTAAAMHCENVRSVMLPTRPQLRAHRNPRTTTMNKLNLATLFACTALMLGAPLAGAATDAQKAEAKAKLDSMTPEQKAAAREKVQSMTPEEKAAAKDKLQSMTPEERAAAKEKYQSLTPEQKAAAKAKWDSLTPEQQAAAKKHRAERREGKADAAAK
jgi:hypothetical protein